MPGSLLILHISHSIVYGQRFAFNLKLPLFLVKCRLLLIKMFVNLVIIIAVFKDDEVFDKEIFHINWT